MATIGRGCPGRFPAEERQTRTARTRRVRAQRVAGDNLPTLLLGSAAVDVEQADAGGGTLIVAMTAGDIPVTTGDPNQGFEGYRFLGYNLYEALVLWDVSWSDKASERRLSQNSRWPAANVPRAGREGNGAASSATNCRHNVSSNDVVS